MRSLPVCALACCSLLPCDRLAAQDAGLASTATVPAALEAPSLASPADTGRRYQLSIPARPLAEALATFAQQTGLRVERPDAIPADARANAVAGLLTAPDALRRLLANTGYRARLRDAETVSVTRWAPGGDSIAQAVRAVTVTVTGAAVRRAGYAPRHSSTATRTDTPLRDVPQAVTVVGAPLIADQAMQGMADVVRYIPGITMGQGEGHRDAPTIRGQSSTADFFVDGVRDDAQYLRDVYNVERVEAIKGPNAMVFGRGGGGGVLNRVTKEAQWAPTSALTLEGGYFGHQRATMDVGQAVAARAAARVTGVYEDSRQFRDGSAIDRHGINPSVAMVVGGTTVRASYEYFADRRTVDRGIPSFDGRPSRAPITAFFGDPGLSRSRLASHAAGVTLERGSSDRLLVRNRTRFVHYDKFYQNVFASGAVNAEGTQVNLGAYGSTHDRTNLFNQTDVSLRVATGRVTQTLLAGAEFGRQDTHNARMTGYFGGSVRNRAVAFGAPTVSGPVEFRQDSTDADNDVRATGAAAYLQDQLALGDHWQAVAGVRVDQFRVRFDNHRNGQTIYRLDRMVSPRAGVVYKPVVPVSVYGAWSVSYLPSAGDQFASLTASSSTLEPESFTNREVGLKWELRPDLALTVAAYRLDRTNTSAPDPLDATRVVQTGAQRTTGWEAGLAGNVTSAWQVAGGFAAQRATITSRTAAAAPGRTVPLVPARTLSLWNRYQVTQRLGAGVGVIRQDDVYAAIDNAVRLPAFTRLDGALYATLTRTVRLQLNLENLLDTRYYPTSHGNNNIMPGAPRTLRMSLTASR
jgi:catecholate siderophore receptor